MPDLDLQRLQRWMSLVTRHRQDADAASRTDEARALIPRGAVLAGEILRPSATMAPLERMDVYNGGYLTRLREVLETDYDALRYALGEERWRDLSFDYVYGHPSRHPNLNVYGAGLPAFVAARRDLPDREFLAELAALQWTVAEAFAAPDFQPLDVNALSGLTPAQWAEAVLMPNPSVRLHRFRYPVNAFLQAFWDGRQPAIPDAPDPDGHHLLAYRKRGRVWRVRLPEPIAAIFAALIDRQPLAAALAACRAEQADVSHWFQEWSADGLFVAVE